MERKSGRSYTDAATAAGLIHDARLAAGIDPEEMARRISQRLEADFSELNVLDWEMGAPIPGAALVAGLEVAGVAMPAVRTALADKMARKKIVAFMNNPVAMFERGTDLLRGRAKLVGSIAGTIGLGAALAALAFWNWGTLVPDVPQVGEPPPTPTMSPSPLPSPVGSPVENPPPPPSTPRSGGGLTGSPAPVTLAAARVGGSERDTVPPSPVPDPTSVPPLGNPPPVATPPTPIKLLSLNLGVAAAEVDLTSGGGLAVATTVPG